MSPSSQRRAQTEPIAAIVAVSALMVGIGLYGVYVTDALSDSSDRTTAEPALDQIWNEIGSDGVFYAYEYDREDPDEFGQGGEVDIEALPYGQSVYITVTTIDEEGNEVLEAVAHFDSEGEHVDQSMSDGPSPEASSIEKPIPVEVSHGEVRGGTLRIEVW